MMTAVCNSDLRNSSAPAQNENAAAEVKLSDAEIMRRVRDIRAGWSLSERQARREEAERRFENLLETLLAEAA